MQWVYAVSMSAKATSTVSGKLVRDVSTTSEFKEAKKHANALGLSLSDVDVIGHWETSDEHPVFPRGNTEIQKVGRKYFHMVLDGESVPVKACEGRSGGKLRLTFKK